MTTERESTVLRDHTREQIEAIGEADILVGIPSFNNARTIGHVVHAVSAGLAKYFPSQRAVLVNSDGGSQDGTPDVVLHSEFDTSRTILVTHPVQRLHKVITEYQGIPGKGSAFRTVFEIAHRVGARACAVVDSDLRSITPEWIELLLAPVMRGDFDYVCPLYSRHKYDGTITNSIVYPLVRAMYGKRIRQPIGGDFGFSGRLATHYLAQDVWDSDVARFGVDIWMTTTALMGGFKVCQAYLGAKIHDAKDPGADLSAMLVQVTGSLFQQLEAHETFWRDVRGSEAVPEFGFTYEVGLEPIHVNIARMVHTFEQGVRDFEPLLRGFLRPSTQQALSGLLDQPVESFHVPTDVWVHTVFDYLLAYRDRRLPVEHLLKSLTPLYLGRTASWVNQARDFGSTEVESELDALCGRFEVLKPELVELWHKGRS
jgi:hypothetical protein